VRAGLSGKQQLPLRCPPFILREETFGLETLALSSHNSFSSSQPNAATDGDEGKDGVEKAVFEREGRLPLGTRWARVFGILIQLSRGICENMGCSDAIGRRHGARLNVTRLQHHTPSILKTLPRKRHSEDCLCD